MLITVNATGIGRDAAGHSTRRGSWAARSSGAATAGLDGDRIDREIQRTPPGAGAADQPQPPLGATFFWIFTFFV
jgi:hypothetical protein